MQSQFWQAQPQGLRGKQALTSTLVSALLADIHHVRVAPFPHNWVLGQWPFLVLILLGQWDFIPHGPLPVTYWPFAASFNPGYRNTNGGSTV